MRAISLLSMLILAGLLAACAQQPTPLPSPTASRATEPASTPVLTKTSLPTAPAKPSLTPSPQETTPAPAQQGFSDCPLPETSVQPPGRLRLAYILAGDLWLLEEGEDPILLTDLGDVGSVKLSSSGENIVFTRRAGDGASELWSLDYSGGEPLRLSGDERLPGQIMIWDFSDDGQYIAFFNEADLWAARLDGTGSRLLVRGSDLKAIEVPFGPVGGAHPTHVAWIPNSHRLTYIPFLTGTHGDAYVYLYDPHPMVDAETGERGLFLPEGQGGYITYSPDRTKMAVVSPTRLSLKTLDGKEIGQSSLEYPENNLDLEPLIPTVRWSADSSFILAAVPAEGYEPFTNYWPEAVWRVTTDGVAPQEMGTFQGWMLEFSPDLKRVAYIRPNEAQTRMDLRLANPDGSEDTVYSSGETYLEFQNWAPDSQHFTYLAYQAESRQNLIGDVCGGAVPLADVPDAERVVAWLDARRYLLIAGADMHWRLHLGTLGEESRLLVDFGEPAAYDFVVMPQ